MVLCESPSGERPLRCIDRRVGALREVVVGTRVELQQVYRVPGS